MFAEIDNAESNDSGSGVDYYLQYRNFRSADNEIQSVVSAAYRVRREFFGKRVKLNFLLNMKSGLCPEDCHYCSQRRDSTADILKYPMVDATASVEAARTAVQAYKVPSCSTLQPIPLQRCRHPATPSCRPPGPARPRRPCPTDRC